MLETLSDKEITAVLTIREYYRDGIDVSKYSLGDIKRFIDYKWSKGVNYWFIEVEYCGGDNVIVWLMRDNRTSVQTTLD